MSKAAERFVCVCCKEPHDEDDAIVDKDLQGPVCPHCHFLLISATVRLKKICGASRVITADDIGQSNFKRFLDYK